MKQILIAFVMLFFTSLAVAGEYQLCESSAAEIGRIYFSTKNANKDGSWPAEIDNNSRAGIHGSVHVDDTMVTFRSRDYWGDVYDNVKIQIPKKTFRCTTKYY